METFKEYLSKFRTKNVTDARNFLVKSGIGIVYFVVIYFLLSPFIVFFLKGVGVIPTYQKDKILSELIYRYVEIIEQYFIEFSATMAAGLFVLLFWEKIAKSAEENEKTYIIKEINRALKGLKKIKSDKAYEKAKTYISNAKEIRVIGAVSLDHWSDNVRKSINEYLRITEERVLSGQIFKYRRISSVVLSNEFKTHLQKCMTNEANRDIQIMLLDDFTPAYTYLLVDDDYLMLSLNFPDQSTNNKIASCYYTENRKIIMDFVEHFKKVWHDELPYYKPASNISEFNNINDYLLAVHHYNNEIKKSIALFCGINTFYKNHALKEIQQTSLRLNSLSESVLEVNHTISNGFLLKVFCIYTDELQDGDTYETITFYKFWKEIVERGTKEPDFIGATEQALMRGAKISRTLIVKNDTIYLDENSFTGVDINGEIIEKYEYFKGVLLTIEYNIRLVDKYPDKYSFKVLFSEKHNDLVKEFYNFAIIKKKGHDDEIVLFEPDNIGNTETTRISFYLKNSKLPQMRQIKERILDKEKKYKIINELWNNQALSKKHLEFMNRINASFFSIDNNAMRVLNKIKADEE